MSIYSAQNYKDVLKNTLLSKKERMGAKGYTFQKMAEVCGVQKTYLSKVLSREGHLTSDQLFLACEYLSLSLEERQFTFLLYELEKSYVEKRKEEILKEIRNIRRKHQTTDSHIKGQKVSVVAEDMSQFYLDPLQQIVHMFLSVEKFARSPSSICEILNIPKLKLTEILKKLESLKVVHYKNDRYFVSEDNLHLNSSSYLYPAYRKLMRLKAMEQIERLNSDQSYNFSVVFSTQPEIKDRIHKEFLELLTKSQKWISAAKETEVYQMNFDLFTWSEL